MALVIYMQRWDNGEYKVDNNFLTIPLKLIKLLSFLRAVKERASYICFQAISLFIFRLLTANKLFLFHMLRCFEGFWAQI